MRLDLLNLVLVLAAAWGGGRLALPAVLGEIGAGLLLGPPVLGLLQTGPALEILAEVGVLLMMLFIGMETDPKDLRRASWAGLSIAVGGFLVPFVGAALVVTAFGAPPLAATFVGVAAGVTSLATKARVLVDLGLTRTRLAHVMMSGAVWTDVASLLFFTALLGAFRASGAGGSVELAGLLDLGARALLFFAGAGLLGGVLLPRLGRWLVAEGRANRTASITLVLVFAIGLAQLAELAGLHGIIGAFVAGLFLRHDLLGRQLAADLRQVVHDAALGFLVPIFFVTVAFDLRPAVLIEDAGLVVALVAVASVGKVVGTALAYLPTGRGWREAQVARRAFCVPEVYVQTAEDGADEAVLRHLGARGFRADRGLSFPRPRPTTGAA